jgi:hypothetical protein
MACYPRWDSAIRCSHAPRVGAGEPRASAATRRVEGAPATATTDGSGPDLLGRAVQVLDELAEFPADGEAGDRGEVAPAGVPALLGVEESTPMRSARDRDGAPRPDSADEPRQSSLGRAADPWRAAEAGPDGLAGDGFEVHAPAAEAAVARFQPRGGNHLSRSQTPSTHPRWRCEQSGITGEAVVSRRAVGQRLRQEDRWASKETRTAFGLQSATGESRGPQAAR